MASITNAILALGNHDPNAAKVLWDRYFERLCGFAESKIFRVHRRVMEADQIASDAFAALFDGIENHRFTKVRNRDEMWQMLTLIAARKASNERKRLDREQRGGGKVRGGSAFGPGGINSVVDFLQRDLSPDRFLELQELSNQLLESLPTDELRRVAVLRMAGHSNAEIAEQLDCVERTVERRLEHVRKLWSEVIAENKDE
ncbi:ECF-type sigma factor [bacterium]|nr:ECF-type sigma factor [bacterium]